MRIACTNANYHSDVVGGGQRSLQFLVEGLAANGHEVRVVSVGSSFLRETVGGVEHVRVPHANLYWGFDGKAHGPLARAVWHARDAWNPTVAEAIESHVLAFEPDIVHTNVMAGISAALWARVAEQGLPVVHTLRDWYVVCARSEMFRNGSTCDTTCFDCRPFTKPARTWSHQLDAVVGNSRFILDRHLQLGAFRDTPVRRVVYNGVTPPDDRPTPTRRPEGPLRLGYLGRLDATKGVEWLLEAFEGLPSGRFTLRVAGSGDAAYETHLQSRYGSEAVQFLGYVRPAELFATIDLLVVPSLWPEPLPRTSFEAYAHAVPVLGSNRGGIPETIDPGKTGYVFDPEHPEAFRKLLLNLANDADLLMRLTEGALAASARFHPDRVVDEYEAIYHEVLQRRGSRAPHSIGAS